jgi:hypothetical protein
MVVGMRELPVPPRDIGNDRYRVPKVPAEVELVLEGGQRVHGYVHLLPNTTSGPERVIDVLLHSDAFLPLTSARESILIQKRRIVLVRLVQPTDDGLSSSATTAFPVLTIEVQLSAMPPKDAKLVGRTTLDMPPDQMRLLDFLNNSGPFFPMVTPDGQVLVARDYAQVVRSIERPSELRAVKRPRGVSRVTLAKTASSTRKAKKPARKR